MLYTNYKDLKKSINYKIIVSPIAIKNINHAVDYYFRKSNKKTAVAFFIVDEKSKIVYLNAIFHTSQNPEKYPKQTVLKE